MISLMGKSLQESLWSPFSRQLYHVLGYLLLSWAIHVVLISIVIFFHFHLDHNLSVIDEWIFDEGWKLVILSKIFALFPVLKFTFINETERYPVWNFLKTHFRPPRKEVFICLFVFLILTISLGGAESSGNEISFFKMFWAFIGTSTYYLTNMLLFLILTSIFNPTKKEKWILGFVFVVLGQLVDSRIFAYSINFSVFVSYATLFIFYLTLWRKPNWVDGAIFTLLGFAPLAAIFGVDPFWGGEFSPMVMSHGVSSLEVAVMLLTLSSYLFYRRKSFNIG